MFWDKFQHKLQSLQEEVDNKKMEVIEAERGMIILYLPYHTFYNSNKRPGCCNSPVLKMTSMSQNMGDIQRF